jgi:hypothetical protein
MTEPRDVQREREAEATAADREPEIRLEVIQDLDLTGADADIIRGGPCTTSGGVCLYSIVQMT